MKLIDLLWLMDDAKRAAASTRSADQVFRGSMAESEISGNMAFLAAQAQHAGLDSDELFAFGEHVRDGTIGQWARAWYEGQLTPRAVSAAYASAYLDGVILGVLFAQSMVPLTSEAAEELREDPRVPAGGWIDNTDGTVVRVRGVDARDQVVYERPRTAHPESAIDEGGLGMKPADQRYTIAVDTERAWAAGFFDGEGNVAATERVLPSGTRQRAIAVQISQSESPVLLVRFRDAVGVGTVKGPYQSRNPRAKEYWSLRTGGIANARAVFDAIAPYLGAVKTTQFGAAFTRWESFEPSAIPCVHGAAYATCSECHRASALKAWETRRAVAA